MLVISNLFMTVAWYAHLKNLSSKPWYIAAFISWGVAFFEYIVQVPANRIGFGRLSLAQLKIIQEVVTLCVFVPFAVLYMKQQLNMNFLWA
ncbi:MAG TPA: DMT family protein, partial [Thermoanaerobaculia bacterium]|nr:DMT family protein [Thermoanaerobaculia bacterium]